jgi:periplasmic protein TonB
MRRRPSVLLISISIHAIVLAVAATAPWWSPVTNWPMPHEVMAFSEGPRVAELRDIELPAPARARASASSPSNTIVDPELAPVVPSTGIAQAEREGATGRSGASFVETPGPGVVEGFGVPSAPPPPVQPPPQPPPQHVGGSVRPPAKIVHVAPQYPALARASRVQGVVIIEATIDSRGNVESATVLRSIPLLDQAALDAVRQWKFTPTLLNGVAVPVIMTVTVNFELSR